VGVQVPPPTPCDVAGHPLGPNPHSGFGFRVFRGCSGLSGAVVAAVGVDGAVAQDSAGCGVDDADVEVVDEEDDGGSVEGSPSAR